MVLCTFIIFISAVYISDVAMFWLFFPNLNALFFNLSESDVVSQINLGAVNKSHPFNFCFQLF